MSSLTPALHDCSRRSRAHRRSDRARLFALTLGLLTCSIPLSAQLTVYEGFDYGVGNTLPPTEQGGFGWSGGWYRFANSNDSLGTRGIVEAGSLATPPGMIPTGNHLTTSTSSTNGERIFAAGNHINTEQNNVIYFSVIGSVSGGNWSFGLYSDRGRIDNPVVSFSVTGGNATMRLYDAFPYETADGAVTRTIATGVSGTFLWVGRLETSAGNDRLDAWIFTDLANVPLVMPDLQAAPAPYVVVNGSNVNIYDVDAIIDRIGYSLGIGSSIDEIRLGGDWASVVHGAAVVPEPATVGLLFGAGALALVFVRRRNGRHAFDAKTVDAGTEELN